MLILKSFIEHDGLVNIELGVLSTLVLDDYVLHNLYKWLNRRSGRKSYNWRNFKKMIEYFNIECIKVSKRNILVDWY